jgi:hypothetical protein
MPDTARRATCGVLLSSASASSTLCTDCSRQSKPHASTAATSCCGDTALPWKCTSAECCSSDTSTLLTPGTSLLAALLLLLSGRGARQACACCRLPSPSRAPCACDLAAAPLIACTLPAGCRGHQQQQQRHRATHTRDCHHAHPATPERRCHGRRARAACHALHRQLQSGRRCTAHQGNNPRVSGGWQSAALSARPVLAQRAPRMRHPPRRLGERIDSPARRRPRPAPACAPALTLPPSHRSAPACSSAGARAPASWPPTAVSMCALRARATRRRPTRAVGGTDSAPPASAA